MSQVTSCMSSLVRPSRKRARLVHTQADQRGPAGSCADAADDVVPKQASTLSQPAAPPVSQQQPNPQQLSSSSGPVLRRRRRLPPHPNMPRQAASTATLQDTIATSTGAAAAAAQPAAAQLEVSAQRQEAAGGRGRRQHRQTSGPIKAAGSNGVSPPDQPSTPDKLRHADRNHAAAAAAVQAAAAGQQPQLQSLLVEPSWLRVLGREFDKPYMHALQQTLQKEWASEVIYPPTASIFHAFNAVPFEKVRVVILGQDPYHGQGQAMGLSFSVPAGIRVPPSLGNIYKELQDDVGARKPNHGCLQKWCDQGVLLLNAVLTVRAGQANSHAGKGWEKFASAALLALTQQRSGIVFLLWGQKAQDRCAGLNIDEGYKLSCPHPSPLAAHGGFFGCRHFSAANELLVKSGQAPIDWQIDDV